MNEIIQKALQQGRDLLEPEAWHLLEEYGINLPKWAFVEFSDSAEGAAANVGYPVVVKVVSADIVHKSDVGGVVVNVKNPEELLLAIETIQNLVRVKVPEARIEGWMITKMLCGDVEVIVGGFRDSQFGATVMTGLGGVFVEIFRDISMGLAPLEHGEALEMIQGLRAHRLLEGYRGKSACDTSSLAQLIVKVGNLMVDFPCIQELDINPVLLTTDEALAVDVRIILDSACSEDMAG